MAIFQDSASVQGVFTEKEFGKQFEYRISKGDAPIQGDWGIKHGYQHEIAVCDGSVRFANVKKTVAYVVVDEDAFGNLIVEKWNIKHNWRRL